MITFEISFRKEIPENRRNVIIDNLISNLSGTSYTLIEKLENDRLLIHGDSSLFSIRSSIPDLWEGFSKKAEVSFEDNKIVYTLDYTLAVVTSSLSFLFITIIFMPLLSKTGDSFISTVYFLGLIYIQLMEAGGEYRYTK